MVYFVQDETSVGSTEKGMNLVEFKFTKETVKSSRYGGAKINAKGLDRLIIWPRKGAPGVFEGRVNIATGLGKIEFQSDAVTLSE